MPLREEHTVLPIVIDLIEIDAKPPEPFQRATGKEPHLAPREAADSSLDSDAIIVRQGL